MDGSEVAAVAAVAHEVAAVEASGLVLEGTEEENIAG